MLELLEGAFEGCTFFNLDFDIFWTSRTDGYGLVSSRLLHI